MTVPLVGQLNLSRRAAVLHSYHLVLDLESSTATVDSRAQRRAARLLTGHSRLIHADFLVSVSQAAR